ncbi:MAG TPA: hypothetical protein VF958_04245 [Thermoanaerobaculia bacterium]
MLRQAALAISLLAAGTAAAPKLKTTGPLDDKAAPEAVRSALEPGGERVLLPEGQWCEVWFRKKIPEEKNSTPGALQSNLGISTAVGVIRFLDAATDFRGQAIPPGLYTLRYATIPNDGNHLGVSEYPDFLLVVPVADDPDPGARFTLEDLTRLSVKATGTKHPGVLSLTRPSGESFPSVRVDGAGHVVLQMKASIGAVEAPIALVVKGQVPQ